MTRLAFVLSIAAPLISAPAFAALALSQSDGAVPATYANGGGSGFGGTLGSGSISMDVVGTDLVVGFTPGNALNDIVALFLDTRPGGFLDAQMSDTADGGRTAISELTLTKDDVYPVGILPDFGVAFGNFGTVLFELNAGNTPGHLTFVQFSGVVGSITIPLATLSNPAAVDFFAGYASGNGYNSNESLPATTGGFNQSGNPGFGDGTFGGTNTGGRYDDFNRFLTGIPEPGTFLIWGLVLVTAGVGTNRVRST